MDSRGFRDGAPRGSDPGMAGRRVYIGNMSYRTTESDIWGFMSRAGDVTGCRIMRLPDGKSKGCALIEYRHPREAEEAIQRLHDLELHGRKVFIREDREPAGPPVSSTPYHASRPLDVTMSQAAAVGYSSASPPLADFLVMPATTLM